MKVDDPSEVGESHSTGRTSKVVPKLREQWREGDSSQPRDVAACAAVRNSSHPARVLAEAMRGPILAGSPSEAEGECHSQEEPIRNHGYSRKVWEEVYKGRRNWWSLSVDPIVSFRLSNRWFRTKGFISLQDSYTKREEAMFAPPLK
jgi:hypothetical protein